MIEFVGKEFDVIVDTVSDFLDGPVDFVIDVVSSRADFVRDGGITEVGGGIDEDFVEEELRDVDNMGVSLVVGGVEFNALSVADGPVVVVDLVAVSDFSFIG